MQDEEEVDTLIECENCGGEMDEGDTFTTSDGDIICGDCMTICDNCNDIHNSSTDDMYWVEGGQWCQDCAENHAEYCHSCNEYTTDGSAYVEDRNETWCISCLENYAAFCESCDSYYASGCDDCDVASVHDWSYKPDPIFHSTDSSERLFFGIEVEMEADNRGYLQDASEYASIRLEREELAYLKRDGSLDEGFELVTHPISFDYYRDHADVLWDTLDTLRRTYNMKSWDTRTCGLHIHISRTGFTSGAHMHRFMNLVYTLQPLFESLAGRSSSRWASFEDVRVGKMIQGHATYYKSFAKKILNGRTTDRYTAINAQNQHTLEMRIFKGSMRKDTIMAQISLAHASVEYTRNLSIHDIKDGALDMASFVKYVYSQPYPELHERLTKVLTTKMYLTTTV
jgi:hypothetical protein